MTPLRELQLGPTEYGLIALQSMLWGSTFFFVALIGDAVPPLTMSALRLVPAVLLLFGVIAWFGLRLPATPGEWVRFFLFSIINNVLPFVLIAHAQREVTGGIAAVFNATAPLFTLFLSAYFIAEERLSWRRVAGILLGVLGVAILIGIESAASRSYTAPLLLLAAAACYGASNVFARRLLGGYQPFALAATQMTTSLILASIVALVVDQPWTRPLPSPHLLLLIATMGTLGSGLASLCHFTVLRRAGATNAMLVTIVLPLTPIVLGALFLGEWLTPREIIGAMVIACALVVIDGRLLTRLRKAMKQVP